MRVAIGPLMQSSNRTRRKAAFVPWLAALVIGATAHAGWLLHELREPVSPGSASSGTHHSVTVAPIHIDIDARVVERLSPARARCRATSRRDLALLAPEDRLDLDLWIHRTARYRYAIDRRVLERVAFVALDGELLERLGVIVRGLAFAEPIELRNIRTDTPLFALGLRTGDRVHAITTRGEGTSTSSIERVEVAIERRGRPIELIYELI